MAPHKIKPTSNIAILCIIAAISITLCIHYVFIFHMTQKFNTSKANASRSLQGNDGDDAIRSYHWPTPTETGGLFGKIYALQNPSDCHAAKYLVWQSLKNHEQDTRGLTAWGHAGTSHLFHALTEGDQHAKHGSRVLINDDKLWPMAKGCKHGPETRECYFEPLTKCSLDNLDPKENSSNSTVLSKNGQEYDRSIRTVYTSEADIWFRPTKQKYSFTGIGTGNEGDHSATTMFAAALAYYFRPKPWLRNEIEKRLKASIPKDLNPRRTVGVPIRRSDKCQGHKVEGSAPGELDCPPLEKYLEGVQKFIEFDPLIENVIVTSEDKSACEEFVEILKKELPQLRVVLNVGDVQQGTGSGNKLESYVESAANEQVVASALTSMHLHLRSRYFVLTTKSTWTSTIAVMAREYGFNKQVMVLDIGRNNNDYSSYARRGG